MSSSLPFKAYTTEELRAAIKEAERVAVNNATNRLNSEIRNRIELEERIGDLTTETQWNLVSMGVSVKPGDAFDIVLAAHYPEDDPNKWYYESSSVNALTVDGQAEAYINGGTVEQLLSQYDEVTDLYWRPVFPPNLRQAKPDQSVASKPPIDTNVDDLLE